MVTEIKPGGREKKDGSKPESGDKDFGRRHVDESADRRDRSGRDRGRDRSDRDRDRVDRDRSERDRDKRPDRDRDERPNRKRSRSRFGPLYPPCSDSSQVMCVPASIGTTVK